jgi:prepilin-type N-terminal cleavage/methylation domain-containing protein
MIHSLSSSRRSAAFTLIELLVVIAIIAILMGLLFPAIQGAKNQAYRAEAQNHVNGICAGVKAYYTEYGKYPDAFPAGSTPSANTDTGVGDPAALFTNNNSYLFNTLRNIANDPNTANAQNPRQIVFFDGKGVANIKTPKAGFMDSKTGDAKLIGCYFDPWGKQYNIVMDTNYDNVITVGQYYSDFATPNDPKVGVGAFSMGKDNKLGNNGDNTYLKGTVRSDDIVSWQ